MLKNITQCLSSILLWVQGRTLVCVHGVDVGVCVRVFVCVWYDKLCIIHYQNAMNGSPIKSRFIVLIYLLVCNL